MRILKNLGHSRAKLGTYLPLSTHHRISTKLTPTNSPVQLKDAGIIWVILGHSERRQYFGEGSDTIAKKTEAVSTNYAQKTRGQCTLSVPPGPQGWIERYFVRWRDT